MASIDAREKKDGTLSWRAMIRIKGFPYMERTFETEAEAIQWAEITEKSLKDPYKFRPTFNMAIDRYKAEILPTKSPGCQEDEKRHLDFWNEYFGKLFLDEITPFQIESTADTIYTKINKWTKKPCGTETRRKYLMSLSYLFTICAKQWLWIKYNPVSLVKKHKDKKIKENKETETIDPIRQVFLDEIKKEMVKRGLSQGGLAHLMGVNKSTVQAIFDPSVNVTVRMMLRVCKALKKRVEFTFHDES